MAPVSSSRLLCYLACNTLCDDDFFASLSLCLAKCDLPNSALQRYAVCHNGLHTTCSPLPSHHLMEDTHPVAQIFISKASSSTLADPLSSSSVVVLPRNYGDLLTRSAKYRNSRTGGARSIRTQIDHDVFEGLPVRHWRKKAIKVNTAPEKENTYNVKSRNLSWPELEMPRDAHLLSEMSQNLLRAARMPQAKKMLTAPSLEDDKEAGEDEDADGELDTGFVAKRWAVMPKEMEGPEPEFLAKRRKGLPSNHGGASAAVGSMQQMRKTKIRKLDASGNSSVLEVLVPDGQTVDGEIFEEETSPIQAPAPGTVVEGVGVANAEGLVIVGDQGVPANNRRRPPLSKRKAKGPGRGKKKKVAFARADGKPTSIEINGIPMSTTRNGEGYLMDGVQGTPDQDTGMGDHSMTQEGDVEGDEGSEEGSEGEKGEDGEREEGELSPSVSPSRSSPRPPSPVKVAARHLPLIPLPHDPTPHQDAPSPTRKTSLRSEPDLGPFTESVDVSRIVQEAGAMDEALDEILDEVADEMLDEPSSPAADKLTSKPSPDIIDTLAEEPMTQSQHSGDTEERIRGKSTEIVQAPASEPVEEVTPEREKSTELSTGDAVTVAMPQAMEQVPAKLTNAMLAEVGKQPIAKPVADTFIESSLEVQPEVQPEPAVDVAEPIPNYVDEDSTAMMMEPKAAFVPKPSINVSSESKAASVPEPLHDVSSEPKAELIAEPSIDTRSEPDAAFISKPSKEVESDSEAESATEPTVEPARKSPAEVITEPTAAFTAESIGEVVETPAAEPTSEPISEVSPPQSTLSSALMSVQAAESPLPAPVVDTSVEVMPESAVEGAAEHPTESLPESMEQSSFFTRPTASLRAPTPSPPTPIEDKFGLRAAYYSPKAPTMSPPTPIARSMPSSPEIPLSGQQFQLPPQIDDMPEADLAPAPDLEDIPMADRISIESTRQGGPLLNAQIPVDHNPLDGLAAPKMVYSDDVTHTEGDKDVPPQWSDDGDDLLGGLERSLNR